MKNNIIAVAFDLKANSDKFKEFADKTLTEQLNQLGYAIEELYAHLQSLHPNYLIIITWPEYGLEKALIRRILTPHEKQQFKKYFMRITDGKHNLVIIAGTIISYKLVDSQKQEYLINKITQKYSTFPFDYPEFVNEKTQFLKFKDSSFYAIRNTCYIFQNGSYQKHDKSIPYLETLSCEAKNLPLIFHPGHINSSFLCIKNKDTQLMIAVTICFETVYIKQVAEQTNYKPDIELVISRTIDLDYENLVGKHVIYNDSYEDSAFIIRENSPAISLVLAYRYDPLATNPRVTFLKPIDLFFNTFRASSSKKVKSFSQSIFFDTQRKKVNLKKLANEIKQSENYDDILKAINSYSANIDSFRLFDTLYKKYFPNKKTNTRAVIEEIIESIPSCSYS